VAATLKKEKWLRIFIFKKILFLKISGKATIIIKILHVKLVKKIITGLKEHIIIIIIIIIINIIDYFLINKIKGSRNLTTLSN
jgi:hypothetical protein